MKTKTIIIGILILVVFLLLFLFLTGQEKKDTTTSVDKTSNEKTLPSTMEDKTNTIRGTIKDLLTNDKNIKCTFLNVGNETKMEGTVYVADKNLRVIAISTDRDGSRIENNTIIKDQFMYTWASDRKEGAKFELSKQLDSSVNPETDTEEEDYKKETQEYMNEATYNCDTWIIDTKLFELPTDINFIDLTESLKNIQESLQGQCDMCNQQQDPAVVAQCKKMLNCE